MEFESGANPSTANGFIFELSSDGLSFGPMRYPWPAVDAGIRNAQLLRGVPGSPADAKENIPKTGSWFE